MTKYFVFITEEIEYRVEVDAENHRQAEQIGMGEFLKNPTGFPSELMNERSALAMTQAELDE